MNRILLYSTFILATGLVSAQGQIDNSDFETWEAVSGNQEPVNWNSFLTADGSWAWAAANQIESSADVRPGSAGTSSCRIWSRSTFGIVANGNVTLGRIHMGSTTPSSPDNYNYSDVADANFSQALTDTPDSLVFWAKFTPNGGNGNARMKCTLHDNNNYRDPEDAASANYVVATAVINFPNTGGNWMRFSVPFNYSGPASANTHILVTFTTNELAGGGNADDEVLIDDVELIYNSNSIDEESIAPLQVFVANDSDLLKFYSNAPINGEFKVYNTNGQAVMSGIIEGDVAFDLPAGIYVVTTTRGDVTETHKVIKY